MLTSTHMHMRWSGQGFTVCFLLIIYFHGKITLDNPIYLYYNINTVPRRPMRLARYIFIKRTDTMEEIQGTKMYCGVPVRPDKSEKKQIRRQYIRTGMVILLNIFLFNIVLLGIAYLVGGIYAGDTTSLAAMKKGFSKLAADYPALRVAISCIIPIISETAAIIVGIKLLKIDLRKLFTFNGFTGGEVARGVTESLGIQMAAGYIALGVGAILRIFNLECKTVSITVVESSLGVTFLLYFYACLLGPVLEEILYRGIILQGLKTYNRRMAVLVSALIFGLMHQNYQQFILGFLLGLLLGTLTINSGSLIPSTVIHIIVNTFASLCSVIMSYVDYDSFMQAQNGVTDMTAFSTQFMILIVITFLIRSALLLAAIVLLIMGIVKKRAVAKPSIAGKTRGWPMLAQSWVWYVILVLYLYLAFVEPMTFIK